MIQLTPVKVNAVVNYFALTSVIKCIRYSMKRSDYIQLTEEVIVTNLLPIIK